jgi:phosphoglucosamine mutase
MSNLGLERELAEHGITLRRTAVGDRYVVEEMRKGDFNLGGEQSGHIVMTDFATTGDGLMAGLQVLALLKESGEQASRLLRQFEPVPQVMENVRLSPGQTPLDSPAVQERIRKAEEALSGNGRLLIRKSGTEPLIRVMGESHDEGLLRNVIREVAEAVAADGR